MLALLVAGCGLAPRPGPPEAIPSGLATYIAADWNALPGWRSDDPSQAWPALLRSCDALASRADWSTACAEARQLGTPDAEQARQWLESRFVPWQVTGPDGTPTGRVTGYYEPLLDGSRTPGPRFRHPLYGVPDDLLVVDLAELHPELKHLRLRGRLDGRRVVPYYSRGEIEAGKAAVAGRELFWVEDPVDLFFLQIQGSGRIVLDNGDWARVGYADHNGHPYRSIGRLLVERGELTLEQASMQGIRDWGRRNPERLPALLRENAAFVFFRELPGDLPGPLGALGVPLTAERSAAVDARIVPLGAPVWLATTRPNSEDSLQRLMLAQDTGGAIKGPARVDFYWGSGAQAGALAGRMRQDGRLWVLLPRGVPPPGGK